MPPKSKNILEELEKEDNVSNTIVSDTTPSKCNTAENTSLVATQVGLVDISTISDGGFRVSGYIKQSPGIKFYSGILFKVKDKNAKHKIRDKAKHINCSTGFTDDETRRKYHLTSIGGTEIKAIPVDSSDVPNVHTFRFNSIKSRFNWIIREGDTVSGLSNVSYTFGESVMPSSRSRVRKSSFLKNKYVPLPPENRKRKAALKKTNINEIYTRYKVSRLSPSTLIDKTLHQQPVYASCLKPTKDKVGIYDTCCNKELPLVFQNLMKYIKTTKHRKKFDSKIEAKKSFNRHAPEGNIDNVSHINNYTPFIRANELDRLVKDFTTFNKEFSMVQDSTHLYDEQFDICCRAMKDEGLWVQQRLIGLWSINHHLSGLNMSFIIEKACDRLGKLISDLITIMADGVFANGIAQKDLVSNGDNLMTVPCFSHTLDKIGKKMMLQN